MLHTRPLTTNLLPMGLITRPPFAHASIQKNHRLAQESTFTTTAMNNRNIPRRYLPPYLRAPYNSTTATHLSHADREMETRAQNVISLTKKTPLPQPPFTGKPVRHAHASHAQTSSFTTTAMKKGPNSHSSRYLPPYLRAAYSGTAKTHLSHADREMETRARDIILLARGSTSPSSSSSSSSSSPSSSTSASRPVSPFTPASPPVSASTTISNADATTSTTSTTATATTTGLEFPGSGIRSLGSAIMAASAIALGAASGFQHAVVMTAAMTASMPSGSMREGNEEGEVAEGIEEAREEARGEWKRDERVGAWEGYSRVGSGGAKEVRTMEAGERGDGDAGGVVESKMEMEEKVLESREMEEKKVEMEGAEERVVEVEERRAIRPGAFARASMGEMKASPFAVVGK